MNKNTQFQIKRRDGKIVMVDIASNEYELTAVQAERLGRQLASEARQLKRAWGLRRLVRRPIGGGGD